MNRNELALARPRHILDLRAYGAHVLLAIGQAAITGASALNDAAKARVRRSPGSAEPRQRHRAGRSFERGRHGVTDAWHLR